MMEHEGAVVAEDKRRVLTKPDGRKMYLYGRNGVSEGLEAPSPRQSMPVGTSHLRWHPLRGEWVAYASHRQDRTFLPPKEYSPLKPMTDPKFPTELPQGDYDIAVFENLFPSLSESSSTAPELSIPTRPGFGVCEVVVFTQDPDTSLGHLDVSHIELLLEVWAERTSEIGAREGIEYVLPFENRGVEMGVTLHHPHGQIYAYPVVPPIQKQMRKQEREFFARENKTVIQSMIEVEEREGERLIFENASTMAFIPPCARYPYEVWLAPKRPVAYLSDLSPEERLDLAQALKTVCLKYDGLWNRPMPYLMCLYQAPVDGKGTEGAHCHFEFYPPYRTRDRLKYLAGTELGAGLFINDSLPEEKARELRAVEVRE